MNYLKRLAVYLLGMVLLALGIVLNTKTALGVSPLVAIAYCVSELRRLTFANTAMVVYLIYFVLEAVLKGRSLRAFDFLQVPFCYFFTRCMNIFSNALPTAESMPLRLGMLVLAIVCTGFGAAIMVAMHLIPNPADGLVQALGVRIGKSMGFAKNLFDAVSVCITLAIGLIAAGRVIGIGLGTVCAVLGTGRAVALCNHLFGKPMAHIMEQAPIRFLGEQPANEFDP
jgi:uncharacterized membrane protein YczE